MLNKQEPKLLRKEEDTNCKQYVKDVVHKRPETRDEVLKKTHTKTKSDKKVWAEPHAEIPGAVVVRHIRELEYRARSHHASIFRRLFKDVLRHLALCQCCAKSNTTTGSVTISDQTSVNICGNILFMRHHKLGFQRAHELMCRRVRSLSAIFRKRFFRRVGSSTHSGPTLIFFVLFRPL
ncbi:uncharacterized protein [Nicotiana tomentosiformis]|uniref:uncharacterized protein n=1 Tax=Nicotiana tomentosiformis TaxID=4098 RepID=UPI00388C789F